MDDRAGPNTLYAPLGGVKDGARVFG